MTPQDPATGAGRSPAGHRAPIGEAAPTSASPRYAVRACRSTAADWPRSSSGSCWPHSWSLVVVFAVVGVHKNHQIDELHDQGVAVNVTITSCQGLLGGSGSNGAGYACRGSYELGGRHYDEQLPGTALHAPGTVIRAVAVPADPALVSPVSVVDSEHSSASVFILPAVLFAVLVALVVVLLLRRRRRPAHD